MAHKKILSFLSAAVITGLIFFLLFKYQKFDMIMSVPPTVVLAAMLLFLASNSFSGWAYYLSFKEKNCILKGEDIFFFPLMQSLAGLIVPFQGSTLFAMAYLKIRYKFKVSDSISVVIFLYLLNFILGGVAGTVYWKYSDSCPVILLFLSIFSILMPLWMWIAYKILSRFPEIPFVPAKIKNFVTAFFQNISGLFSEWKLVMYLVLFQICRHLCLSTALYILARSCDINGSWLWGYLVILSQDVSIIFRFTPGGIGLSELIAGGISSLTGMSAADGIAVGVLQNIIYNLMAIVFGTTGFIIFFRRQKFSLWSLFDKKEREKLFSSRE